ncbi:DNA polymerase [Streptomyces sp. DB-54]
MTEPALITHRHQLAGDQTTIYALETEDDALQARDWLTARQPRSLALDTETSGLDTFSPSHCLRTVQYGTADTAFVVPVERGPAFTELARTVVTRCPELVIHNAAYDLLVLDRHGVASLESVAPRVRDTKILAHLCDSRQDFEGGVGVSLKPLSAWYVDPAAPDTQAGLNRVFRSYGLTKETGWAQVPYQDEVYQRYAGLDVLLAARLRPHLEQELVRHGIPDTLVEYEHQLMTICAAMERRGMLLDVPYTEGLVNRLEEQAATHSARAARYGVENVNSDRQVVAALQGMGESWEETTGSGAPSVAKEVLLPLADLNGKWERLEVRTPNPLADAVLRAKRASKWRTSYAVAMLANRDAQDRIHPKINTLGAKTGRASVSDPPLQQLPSKGWEIRRSVVAESGAAYFSVDQSSVELVVLAALSQEPRMCQAIRDGRNLHDHTATLMFGPAFTKHQRGLAKIAGLGTSYQGGAATLARQTGLAVSVMRDTLARYARAYPGIRRQEGRVAALEALRRYDPDGGALFSTYAHARIKGAMTDSANTSSGPTVSADAVATFKGCLGIVGGDMEAAEYLATVLPSSHHRLSAETAHRVRQALEGAESLDGPAHAGDAFVSLSDTMADPHRYGVPEDLVEPADEARHDQARKAALANALLETLSGNAARIVRMVFGFEPETHLFSGYDHNGLPIPDHTAIAQELGITPATSRQTLKRALDRLRARVETLALEGVDLDVDLAA